MSIKWEEPPTTNMGPRTGRWAPLLAELDERPGVWALIGEDVWASQVTGMRKKYPSYEFRSVSVDSPPNRCNVYARRLP